jgi:hypothetical protein
LWLRLRGIFLCFLTGRALRALAVGRLFLSTLISNDALPAVLILQRVLLLITPSQSAVPLLCRAGHAALLSL